MKRTSAGLLMIAAWAAMFAIACLTLTSASLVNHIYTLLSPVLMHPDAMTYGFIVHILAFAALGSLFAVAYPRNLIVACLIVLGAAATLEALQTLTHDRHGTFLDMTEKLAGGAAGIAAARLAWAFRSRKQKREKV